MSEEITNQEGSNPPQTSLVQFAANMDGQFGDLARQCRFLARVSCPIIQGMDDLTLACVSANFPGKSWKMSSTRYNGPEFEFPTMIELRPLVLSFLIGDDMREKKIFDYWQNVINPESTFDFAYKEDYMGKIELFQYSQVAQKDPTSGAFSMDCTYMQSFDEAWPMEIQDLPLAWDSQTFHLLTVKFNWHVNIKNPGTQLLPNQLPTDLHSGHGHGPNIIKIA